jgi:hypothetical protein
VPVLSLEKTSIKLPYRKWQSVLKSLYGELRSVRVMVVSVGKVPLGNFMGFSVFLQDVKINKITMLKTEAKQILTDDLFISGS